MGRCFFETFLCIFDGWLVLREKWSIREGEVALIVIVEVKRILEGGIFFLCVSGRLDLLYLLFLELCVFSFCLFCYIEIFEYRVYGCFLI